MPIILFFSLLAIFFSSIALADNYVAFLGAGGEPERPFTLFDAQIKPVGDFSKKFSQETQVSFNGGHSKTEELLDKNFPASSNISGENFEKIISSYERRLMSGEIKSGDQLLIYITSHGAPADDSSSTHKISGAGHASDIFSLEGAESIDLSRLKNLTELAKEKGIRLGIVDNSCFSGLTQSLANENTCVISAASADLPGYAHKDSFLNKLPLEMKKKSNLEEAFLAARREGEALNFPMISTAAGNKAHGKLYPLIKGIGPFDIRNLSDEIKKSLEEDIETGRSCKSDQLLSLLDFSESFQDVLSKEQIKKFKKSILNYKKIFDDYKKQMEEINDPEMRFLEEKVTFCSTMNVLPLYCSPIVESPCLGDLRSAEEKLLPLSPKPFCNKISNAVSLRYEPEFLAQQDAKISGATDEKRRDFYLAQREAMVKILEHKQKLLSQNSDFSWNSFQTRSSSYSELKKNLFNDPKNNPNMMKLIGASHELTYAARDFYDVLYRQANESAGPNPCRDFTLNP